MYTLYTDTLYIIHYTDLHSDLCLYSLTHTHTRGKNTALSTAVSQPGVWYILNDLQNELSNRWMSKWMDRWEKKVKTWIEHPSGTTGSGTADQRSAGPTVDTGQGDRVPSQSSRLCILPGIGPALALWQIILAFKRQRKCFGQEGTLRCVTSHLSWKETNFEVETLASKFCSQNEVC